MKVLNYALYTILLLISASPLFGCFGPQCVSNTCNNVKPAKTDESYGNTHWLQRAQGEQLGIFTGVGVGDKINLFDVGCNYGVLAITGLYEHSTKSNNNSSYFAGRDGLLRIGTGTGSKMVNSIASNGTPTYVYAYPNGSQPIDIRASDMGMNSTTYNAIYCMHPNIRNFVLSFDLFAGWDSFVEGLFTRVRVPLTFSKWDLDLTKAQESTVLPIAQLTNSLNFADPNQNAPFAPYGFLDVAMIGTRTVHTLPLLDGNLSFVGNTIPTSYYANSSGPNAALSKQSSEFPLLLHGRTCGTLHGFGVADVPFDIGYNFIQRQRGMLGASFHVVAPAGTKGDDDCIFSPRIGYGRWQVGTQVNAQYTFFDCDERRVTLYFAGFVTYALGTTENRLLGLKANNDYHFNHYLLLKKFSADGTLIALERAANLLYQPIKLSGFANSDLAVWLQYQSGKFDFSVGWNFVGRQAEGFKANGATIRAKDLTPVPNAVFGNSSAFYVIKGDTPLWLINDFVTGGQQISPHCYSKADSDIKTLGTLIPLGSVAPATGQTVAANLAEIKAAAFTAEDVVAAPALHDRMITNAFFFYFGYNWLNHPHVEPFIGIGGQYEAGHGNAAMDMWAVFMKGGFAF